MTFRMIDEEAKSMTKKHSRNRNEPSILYKYARYSEVKYIISS